MIDAPENTMTKAEIKRFLADNALRLGTDAEIGERCLEQHDPARGWQMVARRVRSWSTALTVAITLGLCPSPKASDGMRPAAEHGSDYVVEVRDGKKSEQVVIKLLDYQRRAIEDQHRIVILCWCRQAGKDFTTSLKAVIDAMETGEDWYIVSLTQRQALATAKKAQMHARAISGVLPKIVKEDHQYTDRKTGQAFTITQYGVRLKNGAQIIALPGKDPDALAGLTGNVIFTEMALFPNNGIDHWRVVFPLSTRGFKVWAISTPRGPETKFSELRRNAAGEYSVHNVTIHDAVAGGLELKDHTGKRIEIEQLEAIYADPQGWEREYMCVEGEDHEALIDWQWINTCGDAECVIDVQEIRGARDIPRDRLTDQFDEMHTTYFADIRARMKGRPALGWDIAVRGDLSVVAYGESLADVTYTRSLVIMDGVDDFDYQEEVVSRAMETGASGVGDATGLGMEACQRLEKRFGQHRFKGVNFGGGAKTELFMQFRDIMQRARLRIDAANDVVKYDIHAIAKEGVGIAQRLRILTLRNPLLKDSHGDIATALALMVDAASGAPDFHFQAFDAADGGDPGEPYSVRAMWRGHEIEQMAMAGGAAAGRGELI
jgi:phage FluMu gp28-like protein